MSRGFCAIYILVVIAVVETTCIFKSQFIHVFCYNYSLVLRIILMSQTVMKPLENTACIVFPYLSRDKTVLRINLKTVVADSIHQGRCGKYKRNGVSVTECLTILMAFPYNFGYMREFMSFLSFSNQQQCCSCYLAVKRQTCFVEEYFITPTFKFVGILRITLRITFLCHCNGLLVKVFNSGILHNMRTPIYMRHVYLSHPVRISCQFCSVTIYTNIWFTEI